MKHTNPEYRRPLTLSPEVCGYAVNFVRDKNACKTGLRLENLTPSFEVYGTVLCTLSTISVPARLQVRGM